MATGFVISVAEKLFDVLHSQELKEICSMFGYKSELDDLKTTVLTIKSVLLDAESNHQELTNEGRDYVERLKDAIYDVDDLLDEFNTMVLKEKNKIGGKVSKKVHRFFSRTNRIVVAYNMSHEINLRGKLDKIAKDHQQFGLSDVYVPLKKREETMSFTSEDKIIGRETEKEAIVGMLLGDLESSNDVGFVTVVGMGGLGKTALAQLVYNDPRIENAFELTLWVCVSDDFSLDKIFQQMLGGKNQESNIEQLQGEVRKLIQGKRYLLVLDDVWNEYRHEWGDLKTFLNLGGKGSRVLVTSRSKKVASVVGDDLIYELQGLTDDFSWNLFKRLAFKQGKEPINSNDRLFDVGKEIVKKCANVPLLIRVVGSMLYDQDDSLWQSLKNSNLLETREHQCSVMPVLKYSYYHLTPALKSCFSYCALFSKDFKIKKKFLVRLWLAQGCLGNSHDCRSEEDVGEEYFSILLQRCFFQDIEKDDYGEIQFCKMHDLIHDLALEVAGKEAIILDSRKNQFDKRSRHLSFTANGVYLLPNHSMQLSDMKSLRTFFTLDRSLSASKGTAICQHLTRLRVLSFHGYECETLPETLGNLLQLRYLDLSFNMSLKVLPNSITKLINLLVLILDFTCVRELPCDMRKLVNLRHLSLCRCKSLTHMPPGLDTLTSLHILTTFVLGDETSKQGQIGKLRDLKALVNLRDELTIKFQDNFICDVAEYKDIELLRLAPLKHLNIDFNEQGAANHETLLSCLQPHCMLSTLSIHGYRGFKKPLWAESLTSSLPHLVTIRLENFNYLDILPPLSQLHHLKYLKLKGISNVEFVENDEVVIPLDKQLIFFPSLEELELNNLPKLKGWWREESSKLVTAESSWASSLLVPSFPCLRKLVLSDCPNLTVFPSCPKLVSVVLKDCHEALTLLEKRTVLPCNATTKPVLYLEKLTIDNEHNFAEANSLMELKTKSCPHLSSWFETPEGYFLSKCIPQIEIDGRLITQIKEEGDEASSSAQISEFDDKDERKLYFCLFPNDYEFERETLVQLWMAAGYFKNGSMEELAGIYFDSCIDEGHILSVGIESFTGVRRYKINVDRVVDVPTDDRYIVWKGETTDAVVTMCQHISVMSSNINHKTFETLKRCHELRTLLFFRDYGPAIKQVPSDMFLALQRLESLNLSCSDITELPGSIGSVTQLRLLDLSFTLIERLPETIDRLVELQTLKLEGCKQLYSLPSGMKKLIKLRHLYFDVLGQLSAMPKGIGALTELRTLSAFIVDVKEGCNLRDLKDMNNLRGRCCISGLESVSENDALVCLKHKQHVTQLQLRWDGRGTTANKGNASTPVYYLEPHSCLEKLELYCYPDTSLPYWIAGLSNLSSITFFKCEITTLNATLGKLPNLKYLDIIQMNKVKTIEGLFCEDTGYINFFELRKLTVDGMCSLISWKRVTSINFPCLSEFTIKHCPKIKALPGLAALTALEYLEISYCEELEALCDEKLSVNLKTLVIDSCPLLTKRCSRDGEEWFNIQHIPDIWIEQENISSPSEDDSKDGEEGESGDEEADESESDDEEAKEGESGNEEVEEGKPDYEEAEVGELGDEEAEEGEWGDELGDEEAEEEWC